MKLKEELENSVQALDVFKTGVLGEAVEVARKVLARESVRNTDLKRAALGIIDAVDDVYPRETGEPSFDTLRADLQVKASELRNEARERVLSFVVNSASAQGFINKLKIEGVPDREPMSSDPIKAREWHVELSNGMPATCRISDNGYDEVLLEVAIGKITWFEGWLERRQKDSPGLMGQHRCRIEKSLLEELASIDVSPILPTIRLII